MSGIRLSNIAPTAASTVNLQFDPSPLYWIGSPYNVDHYILLDKVPFKPTLKRRWKRLTDVAGAAAAPAAMPAAAAAGAKGMTPIGAKSKYAVNPVHIGMKFMPVLLLSIVACVVIPLWKYGGRNLNACWKEFIEKFGLVAGGGVAGYIVSSIMHKSTQIEFVRSSPLNSVQTETDDFSLSALLFHFISQYIFMIFVEFVLINILIGIIVWKIYFKKDAKKKNGKSMTQKRPNLSKQSTNRHRSSAKGKRSTFSKYNLPSRKN